MSSKLLHTPDGVRDLYGEELSLKAYAQKKIRHFLRSYGYREIQTPTFEYFDMFSSKIGTTPSKELYKFFDKEGDTLVLRPDFTPSIARCAAKYYMDESIPVRFWYKGNAFTNSGSLQGKLRENTQMGAELIGDGSAAADAEMIGMCIKALSACGLRDYQISVGNIEFMKGLCEDAKLSEETEALLRDYISIKNFYGAEEVLKSNHVCDETIAIFRKVSDCYDDPNVLNELKTMSLNDRCLGAIERLQEIGGILREMGVSKYVSYDLGMVSKYNYYTGMIFKAYTYGVGDAIVKGGRYDSLLEQFDKSCPATGFVVLIDDLVTALKRADVYVEAESVTMILYKEGELMKALGFADTMRLEGKNAAIAMYTPDDLAYKKEAFVRDGLAVHVI